MAHDLEFTVKEKMPKETLIFQVEDGTIFYRNYKYLEKLYVKWQGNEIEAKLPGKVLFNLCAIDNALYFQINDEEEKFYKAEFTPSNGIDISNVRDVLEDERSESKGLMSRLINGKRYVYRMNEDPDSDGILVDASYVGLVIGGVHRGKIIYLLEASSSSRLTARKLSDNAILIEGPGSTHLKSFSTPDSSKFLYFAFAMNLWVLDTETLEFLAPLELRGIDSISDIAGIKDGMLTVSGRRAKLKYVMAARLPKGYYE